MRPIKSPSPSTPPATTSSSGLSVWKSPVPYLFGGLTIVLALISVALIVLICSYTKGSSQSSSPQEEEDEADDFKLQVMAKTDSEPKILVIMAGDDEPTHLARPIVPLSYCACHCQPTEPIPSSSASISNDDQKSH